jgi:hypothetical protein
MINMTSPPHNIKLFGRISNETEKQGPKGKGSNSTPFATTPRNTDVSTTSWPELRKSVLYQRHGNKSKLAEEHVLKEGIKPGSEVKENDDIGSITSKSDIVNNVFVSQTDMSFTPLQASGYSSKTKGCSSGEERLFNNSSTTVELGKDCSKNKYQFYIATSEKPQTSAGIHNCTTESERCTVYGNVSGVACEKEKLCGNPLAAAGTSQMFCDVTGDKVDLAFKHLQKREHLPQPQLKESIINGNIEISSNKIRSSQRKIMWKEEKKRAREEEARKRMLAPQSQRVRLVSHKMLEALLNSDAENISFSAYQRDAPAINEKEFPTMEESRKQRMKIKDELSCGVQGDELQGPSCESKVKKEKNLGSNSDCVNSSSAEEQIIVPANSMTVRNKKKRSPIQIDLVSLIKVGILLA